MVSLIIPCYNGEKFINRCLDSVLDQSYKDIELIFVNDGSTDKTSEIINIRKEELEKKLTQFIYIEQENQGVGASCNNAFKKVTGEYLTLLDIDDLMLPDSIKQRKEWLDNNPSYGFVRTNGYYVTEENLNNTSKLLEVNDYMKSNEEIFDELFNGTTYVWPGTYMIRMDLLNDVYPNRDIYPSRNGQNLQFLLVAAYKSKAGFIDVPLMKYVVQSESLSHFSSGNILERKVQAMLGYKEIRKNLIMNIMNNEDRNLWLERLEILYEKIFMQLANEYNEKALAKKHYQNLKKIMKNGIDLNTRIDYYRSENLIVYLVLRIIRKFKTILD